MRRWGPLLVLISLLIASCAGTATVQARDHLWAVGSSTVYPFTLAVAEHLAREAGTPPPQVESTGTGPGLSLFCGGVGAQHPDVLSTSRRIRPSELYACENNGVTRILEIPVGLDGITIVHQKSLGSLRLTRRQIFLALAARVPGKNGALVDNPYRKWADVDASLPDTEIRVFGPPLGSGTRDMLHELFLEPGAGQIPELNTLKSERPEDFASLLKIRSDGHYDGSEDSSVNNLQKLMANRNAFAIVGYSFYATNREIDAAIIDGVPPTYEMIAESKYPGARKLYLYIKLAHANFLPSLGKLPNEYYSSAAFGVNGYLMKKGIIPLGTAEFLKTLEVIQAKTPLALSQAYLR
jgi:phosphate transport system substrate-binding protein